MPVCTLSIKFEASFYGYRCVNGNDFVTSYKPFKVQRHRGRMESVPCLNMWMSWSPVGFILCKLTSSGCLQLGAGDFGFCMSGSDNLLDRIYNRRSVLMMLFLCNFLYLVMYLVVLN
jgi:hypothetical protein